MHGLTPVQDILKKRQARIAEGNAEYLTPEDLKRRLRLTGVNSIFNP